MIRVAGTELAGGGGGDFHPFGRTDGELGDASSAAERFVAFLLGDLQRHDCIQDRSGRIVFFQSPPKLTRIMIDRGSGQMPWVQAALFHQLLEILGVVENGHIQTVLLFETTQTNGAGSHQHGGAAAQNELSVMLFQQ